MIMEGTAELQVEVTNEVKTECAGVGWGQRWVLGGARLCLCWYGLGHHVLSS